MQCGSLVALTLSAFVLLAACVANDEPAPTAPDLVITGGTVVDMTTDAPDPQRIKALVVRGGSIDRIIPAGSAETVPEAATTIDAGDGYILPGFIDAHVHFRPFLHDAGIWKRASNHYGITTLFDTGPCGGRCPETGRDPNEWIGAYKTFMNSTPVPDGPTLYITGQRIQGLDGTHPLGRKVASRDEIVEHLDRLVALGVDGVKVEAVLSAELRAIVVAEAEARGLPVVGHSRDAYESIAAGMKFIEHMWPITSSIAARDPGEKFNSPQHDHLMDLDRAPKLIEALVDNGVYVNPTLLGRYGYFADAMRDEAGRDFRSFEFGGLFSDLPRPDQDGVRAWWARAAEWDAERLATHRQALDKVETFLKLFSEAGGRILIATDSGEDKLVGIALHREMSMLGDAGVAPYRILLGATRWPAELARKDELIGTLAAGKRADILVLGSDPTADIANSRDIDYVIKKGTIVRSPADCSVIRPPIAVNCEN